MDLVETLIRSMAAIDSSRNKQQATVLLNYRSRKLMVQAKFSRRQNQRSRVAMREACATVVSSSFTTFARTGGLLERWESTVQGTAEVEVRTVPVSGPQKDSDSAPRQRHKVQKAGQGADNTSEVKLYA